MNSRLTILISFIISVTLASFANDLRNKTKVACIGNSITYGTKIEDRDNMSYPAQLGRMLGDGFEVTNFGHPGATLLFKGHNPYIKLPEWKAVLDYVPDIAVIHLGINDTDPRDWPDYGDNFVADYLTLIDSLRAVNPTMRIIIAKLTPIAATHPRFKSGTRDWRLLVNEAIERVGEIAGVEVTDFSTYIIDRPELLVDGVHPSSEGAKLLAEIARGVITGNYGGLSLPQIFSDNMVLQRYRPIRIHGRADAGSIVSVTIGNNHSTAITDPNGNFTVTLAPMSENDGLTMTVTDGQTSKSFKNVAIGEVWLASGQSNMAFTTRNAFTFQADSSIYDDPKIRLFDMKPIINTFKNEWPDDIKDSIDRMAYYKPTTWKPSTHTTAANLSAIAWYFAKTLRDSLDVPVGIISNSIGGSGTEAWIDIESLQRELPEVLINWRHNDYLQGWVKQTIAKNVGETPPLHRHPYEPSYLFATGIRPLAAYPIAGTIWYQGESNAHNSEVHNKLFKLLVNSWRTNWDQPEMPFIYAQISSHDRPSWPAFRDSQRRLVSEISNTAMVVTSDLGDSLDVHPRNKRQVGERMARQALNRVYSMNNITPSGPMPIKAERIAPGTIEITMEYGQGMHASDGASLRTFEIAAIDGDYYPAEATVVGPDRIKLINMNITEPRYARYAWQPFTRANLVNSDGLPASTFVISVTETPDQEEEIDCGVAAPYVGIADGTIIRAGGANFPNNPMAPGSYKKYYTGIYAINPGPDGISTTLIGHLPQAMGYGCGVTTPQGLAVIAGNNGKETLRSAYMINVDDNGKAVVSALPDFPAEIDNMGACYADGKIYVVGGTVNGKSSNTLFALNLSDINAGWKRLKDFPGNPRLQPAIAATQVNGKTMIYMWGGFSLRSPDWEPTFDTDGLCYDPVKSRWTKLPSPTGPEGEEISVAGGTAVALPSGEIMVMGGVDKDIFLGALRNQAPDYLSHPVDWYRFNPYILLFNPQNGQWTALDKTQDAARAGGIATLTPDASAVLLIGGEIKPRIRTANILSIPVK